MLPATAPRQKGTSTNLTWLASHGSDRVVDDLSRSLAAVRVSGDQVPETDTEVRATEDRIRRDWPHGPSSDWTRRRRPFGRCVASLTAWTDVCHQEAIDCHSTAMGLIGDPVPVGRCSGAMTHRKDHLPVSSQAGTRSPNWR